MLPVMVVFSLVVVSNAGVIHQHQAGGGLNYHQLNGHAVRHAFGRPYIAPSIGFRPAPLLPSTVFNSVPFNHAITPLTVTSVASPLLYPSLSGAGYPTSTITKVLPTVSSAPLATLSNHIPSVSLNSSPINFAALHSASNIQISPATSFINQPASLADSTITSSYKTINVIPEKSVSYSISHQDYKYLKRHKEEGQDSPYNLIPGFNTSPEHEKHQNSHTHHENDKALINIPQSDSVLKSSTALNSGFQVNNDLRLIHGNSKTSFIQDNNGLSFINGLEPVIQNNIETSFIQQGNTGLNLIQESSANSFNGNTGHNSGTSFINVPEPVVSKHIYFHAPPPDFEEPVSIPITSIPPKKTYNILFIKAPSQNIQSNVYLQQLLQNKQNQIEDKTLIYVLSKKQDPLLLPTQEISKASSPEVFFVKYKTKAGHDTDISKEHVEQSLIESISSNI